MDISSAMSAYAMSVVTDEETTGRLATGIQQFDEKHAGGIGMGDDVEFSVIAYENPKGRFAAELAYRLACNGASVLFLDLLNNKTRHTRADLAEQAKRHAKSEESVDISELEAIARVSKLRMEVHTGEGYTPYIVDDLVERWKNGLEDEVQEKAIVVGGADMLFDDEYGSALKSTVGRFGISVVGTVFGRGDDVASLYHKADNVLIANVHENGEVSYELVKSLLF